MRTPLAWLNLVHNKPRTAVAIAGITFSVILIFMQLGFLGAVGKTATMVFEGLDFDIAIRSPEYLFLTNARTIPIDRLHQARTINGVDTSRPFFVSIHVWRNPLNGQTRSILCLGLRPDENVFSQSEIREQRLKLARPNSVLIDRLTRRDFGPKNGNQFSDEDIDKVFENESAPEIGYQRVSIVGHFALGTGLASDGAVVMSERSFQEIFGSKFQENITAALIKVEEGQDPEVVAMRLRDELPHDVDVLTREQVMDFEFNHWVYEKTIGVLFQLGVAMAIVVGVAIVYQVLSSDVESQLAQYATLKAIGYGNEFLAKIVLRQSVLLACLGFIPGFAISQLLYIIIGSVAYIPIEMSFSRIALVFLLTLIMCTASGLGALLKVRSADPADLF